MVLQQTSFHFSHLENRSEIAGFFLYTFILHIIRLNSFRKLPNTITLRYTAKKNLPRAKSYMTLDCIVFQYLLKNKYKKALFFLNFDIFHEGICFMKILH